MTNTSTGVLLLDDELGRDTDYVTKMVDLNRRNTPRQVPPPCLAGQQADDIRAAVDSNRM